MRDIKTITIIGANGTVGLQVAQLLVAKTTTTVFLVCRSKEKAEKTIKLIHENVLERSLMGTLIPSDYSEFETCIKKSDWVFESVAEDLELKKDINREINRYLDAETIVSTGTSSFLIETLSSVFSEQVKANYFGTHFFNPPDKLPLLELICNQHSDREKYLKLHSFLFRSLERKIIETKDTPAFLANRIGILFLNEVAVLAEKFAERGGIDYLDAIMGTFTGRKLPPLKTIDFIGIDVFISILHSLNQQENKSADVMSKTPDYLEDLQSDNHLGKKTGIGLYKTEILHNGIKERLVFDIKEGTYRPIRKYTISYVPKMKEELNNGNAKYAFLALMYDNSEEAMICKFLLLKYIIISYQTAFEVTNNIEASDVAMEFGYSWIPPGKLVTLFGGYVGIRKIIMNSGQLKASLGHFNLSPLKEVNKEVTDEDLKYFKVPYN